MVKGEITVSVVYALPDKQWLENISVPMGSTLEKVLQFCQSLPVFANLDLAQHKVGIYGKIVARDHVVQAGERIEIYRPLLVDPMTARRLRAQQRAIKATQKAL